MTEKANVLTVAALGDEKILERLLEVIAFGTTFAAAFFNELFLRTCENISRFRTKNSRKKVIICSARAATTRAAGGSFRIYVSMNECFFVFVVGKN